MKINVPVRNHLKEEQQQYLILKEWNKWVITTRNTDWSELILSETLTEASCFYKQIPHETEVLLVLYIFYCHTLSGWHMYNLGH